MSSSVGLVIDALIDKEDGACALSADEALCNRDHDAVTKLAWAGVAYAVLAFYLWFGREIWQPYFHCDVDSNHLDYIIQLSVISEVGFGILDVITKGGLGLYVVSRSI